MVIRRAKLSDVERIEKLLVQVNMVHHVGRPDLFIAGARKYTREELTEILQDDNRPVLVAADDADQVLGYAFCVIQSHIPDNNFTDIITLYIDDLCVDEEKRGRHIGTALYQAVLAYAKELGCYNVTLNVWTCNESAMKFYEACGMKPQKIGMETILL